MTADDDGDDSSGELVDSIKYHLRFVSAVLDVGVEHASPLQIYEQMTLPKDPDRPSFQKLKLEQIKSHLQRFRKVYKMDSSERKKRGRSSKNNNDKEIRAATGINAEKKDFLDEYEIFVDFGLDAAAARNVETHKSIVGGRAIGLTSRMVMMDENVNLSKFSNTTNSNLRNWDKSSMPPPPIENRAPDKTIPKLSPAEEASALGRSIKLVVGLLEHLNNHIAAERQKDEQRGYESDISSLGAAATEIINGISFTGGKKRKAPSKPLLAIPPTGRELGTLSFLPPITEVGRALPPKPPIFSAAIDQPQNQQRRERLLSCSDVSSFGDEEQKPAISKPKDQPHYGSRDQITDRLGKFFPVKESENNIQLESRVYRPPLDRFNHTQREWQQSPSLLGSFEVPSPAINQKAISAVEFPPQPLSVLTTTAALATAFTMARLQSNPQLFKALQQQQPRSQSPRLSKKRRRASKDSSSTKHVFFHKLKKAISEISFSNNQAEKKKRDDGSSNFKCWFQSSDPCPREDAGDCSVVSSLSSSSSSGGFQFDDDENRGRFGTGMLDGNGRHRCTRDTYVAVPETTERKKKWTFDWFSMKRDYLLRRRSKNKTTTRSSDRDFTKNNINDNNNCIGTSDEGEHSFECADDFSSQSSCSAAFSNSSSECSWGLVVPATAASRVSPKRQGMRKTTTNARKEEHHSCNKSSDLPFRAGQTATTDGRI